ncbi:MAG: SDR family oxidoreductase [Candidatus Abyssobacteria bacterium SURF_5]|uniref:SDR family oxidoreductase n=1 Tax=Abyssobacteria bacterium (strain SURF_5) TaxID=2093360 RepID=A0A3A4P5Q0_ABYX5|nr:MAG: SDR family oxidoreductase [Candidatus Abyssubacteria bacterium SURF_5]
MKIEELFSVKDKIALVTGGSRGLGLVIARAYVENEAKVYVSSRKADACKKAAEELSAFGECIALPADVSLSSDRERLVRQLVEREKHLNILVNNAGAAWGAPLEEYPEDGFDKVMDLNVKSVFMLTRDLLPLLQKAASPDDPARIINLGSMEGIMVSGYDNYAYSISKAAVHHMTKVLSAKVGPRAITVNAIAPGYFETKMTNWMLATYRDEIVANAPLGRLGTPPDIAGIAIYLASRAGAYVNGAIIPVDGGTSAK